FAIYFFSCRRRHTTSTRDWSSDVCSSDLSAAYYLALMGHSVTVYEQRKQLGGMLRYGIPCYRFPRELLDREIASILSLGITVHKIGRASCREGEQGCVSTAPCTRAMAIAR